VWNMPYPQAIPLQILPAIRKLIQLYLRTQSHFPKFAVQISYHLNVFGEPHKNITYINFLFNCTSYLHNYCHMIFYIIFFSYTNT
jgi:hypothetical protein